VKYVRRILVDALKEEARWETEEEVDETIVADGCTIVSGSSALFQVRPEWTQRNPPGPTKLPSTLEQWAARVKGGQLGCLN